MGFETILERVTLFQQDLSHKNGGAHWTQRSSTKEKNEVSRKEKK